MRMRTFQLNKLVRDGIVAGHEQEGGSCVSHEAEGDELLTVSEVKVREEVEEMFGDDGKKPSGYSDVIEAVFKLAEVRGFSRDQVIQSMLERTIKIGSYCTNTYVVTATVPETSWLATYYANDPERFPEI